MPLTTTASHHHDDNPPMAIVGAKQQEHHRHHQQENNNQTGGATVTQQANSVGRPTMNITIPNNNNNSNNAINLDIKRNSLEKSPLAIVNSYKERKYKLFKQQEPTTRATMINPSSSSMEQPELKIGKSSPRNRSASSGSPISTSSNNTSLFNNETLPITTMTTTATSGNVLQHRNNITIDSIHHHHHQGSNFVNSNNNTTLKQPLNTLLPASPTSDITPMAKKRSTSFDENSGSGEIVIEDEHVGGKQEKSKRNSIRHHQREKFQLSGENFFRKPSPKRSQSEDVEKYHEDLVSDLQTQQQQATAATSAATTEDSKGHFHSLPSRSASIGSKKAFPANWISTNNTTTSSNKFKGIGNPEYSNTTNPALAIKHSFKELKKNIKDEVKKGVSTVKNAPSFIKSVPKKIMPTYLVTQPKQRETDTMSSLDNFDFYVPPEEPKRQAIGELYVTDIQTRNLKSVEGYNTNESTAQLNTSNSSGNLGGQKRSKSIQALDVLGDSVEENTENILFEDFVTYCEVLCEGKKHTTMNLGGAYLNKKLKWQEEFKFYISDESSSISIEIFHSPPKPKSKNEIICLGFISIPLSRIKLNKDRIFDDWFSLITPLGTKTFSQVHLRFQYIPYQNPALSAKDLELLDRMDLNPIIQQVTPLRDKPEHKSLLDSLNIDVSDDLLSGRVQYQPIVDSASIMTDNTSTTDISQSTFVGQTPRSFALYDNLFTFSGKSSADNNALQKVKDELHCTEKTLLNEIHNLKLDLLDTKKRVNDAHEQSGLQMTAKNVTIDKLKNKVEKMESRMNHLSTIVLQLNSAQANTKDKVTSHEEDIKLYESRLKELETKVNSMHSARISTKLKEWVFYLLAFLLFFFSQILVLTGFVFNKIKLRRPPTSSSSSSLDEEDMLEDDENEESTFNFLRKRMEGVEKKYRDMAMKTNTPLGNMPSGSSSPPTEASPSLEKKETFLSQITKAAVMLPFKNSPLTSSLSERKKPTMSFATLERQNELKDLLSPSDSSASEEGSFPKHVQPLSTIEPLKKPTTKSNKVSTTTTITALRHNTPPSLSSDSSSSSESDEENTTSRFSKEKLNSSRRIFEDVNNNTNTTSSNSTRSLQFQVSESHSNNNKDQEVPSNKVIVPEHQQSYLFNQLKQSFNEEEELTSPQSAETTTSPQLIRFEEHHLSNSQQQSIIDEEAEKLQTISQFFRKTTDSAGLKKRLSNAATNVPINSSSSGSKQSGGNNEEEEDDFDSWFSNKLN